MGLSLGHCSIVPASMVAQKLACHLAAALHLKSCCSSVWLRGGSYNTLITVVSEHSIISKMLEYEWLI